MNLEISKIEVLAKEAESIGDYAVSGILYTLQGAMIAREKDDERGKIPIKILADYCLAIIRQAMNDNARMN